MHAIYLCSLESSSYMYRSLTRVNESTIQSDQNNLTHEQGTCPPLHLSESPS